MCILNLPNELLLLVSEELIPNTKDLKSFLSVNHRLYFLLLDRLHRLAIDDKNGLPALYWAVKKGHMPLFFLLLESRVDLNARETQTGLEKTALHCAAELGNKKIITALLERGASVDLRDSNGRTALINAIMFRHFSVARALLDSGADINLRDNEGITALHCAVYSTRKTSNDTEQLIRSLVSKGAAVDHLDLNNTTPLYLAIARNHNAIVKLLLEYGANLLLQSDRGYDAIHRAVMNNDAEMVELLLEQQGVDVNHRDEDGKTALHYAASLTIRGEAWDLRRVIRLLLSKGGDISIKDKYGSVPLVLAKGAAEDVCKLLGQRAVPVSCSGNYGGMEVWRQGMAPVHSVR